MKLFSRATILAAAYASLIGLATVSGATPLESYGVAGDMDKKSRNPHLTVSSTIGANQVTILADAAPGNEDFNKYPVVFEFFVNGNLLTTQYRSPTLNRPVGVTVPSSVATVPFNYVVVAKVIHPNSIYTTVIEAAAEEGGDDNTTKKFDCTVVLASEDDGGDDTLFTASDVTVTQKSATNGNTETVSEFTAKSEDGTRSVTISADAITGTSSSGTVTISEEGKDDVSFTGDAVVTSEDVDGLKSLEIGSEDGNSSLSCSR